MRFVLTIELGNDAMQTWSDIAKALRNVAAKHSEDGTPAIADSFSVRDVNGNRVGSWHIDEGA